MKYNIINDFLLNFILFTSVVRLVTFLFKNAELLLAVYNKHQNTCPISLLVYNGHYTGSQLWIMGCREYDKVLSTYNRSEKIMYDLPWATHRSLIEPLTGTKHVCRMLVKRYLRDWEVREDKSEAAPKSCQEWCQDSDWSPFEVNHDDHRRTILMNWNQVLWTSNITSLEKLENGKETWYKNSLIWSQVVLRYLACSLGEIEQILEYIWTGWQLASFFLLVFPAQTALDVLGKVFPQHHLHHHRVLIRLLKLSCLNPVLESIN